MSDEREERIRQLADPLADLLRQMDDPVWQAEHALRLAEYEANRTDPWRWYCRLCGAEGYDENEPGRDHAAFGHVEVCPWGRRPRLGTKSIGRLRHVWSY